MTRTALATLAAALACLAPAARAQPVSDVSGPDTYLQLRAGAFEPQSGDLDGLDTGWEIGGRFGARFTPNVSVEAGLAYYRAEGPRAPLDRVSSVPLTAGLRLRAPLQVAELSVFGGGGIHFTSASGAGLLGRTSDRATAFGYELGGELAFNLSPMMRVGGEVRWTSVEPRLGGARLAVDGLHVAVTLGYEF